MKVVIIMEPQHFNLMENGKRLNPRMRWLTRRPQIYTRWRANQNGLIGKVIDFV